MNGLTVFDAEAQAAAAVEAATAVGEERVWTG